jgi:hypothetical protein
MDPQFDYDVPPGIVLSGCVPGGEWSRQMYSEEAQTGTGFWTSWRRPFSGAPSAAEATFDLPLEYARIFLMARGQLSSGIVDVITSSTQPSNTVSVRVHIQHARDEAHNLAKVCKLARNPGQAPEGVGIFVSPDCYPFVRNRFGRYYLQSVFVDAQMAGWSLARGDPDGLPDHCRPSGSCNARCASVRARARDRRAQFRVSFRGHERKN